MPTEEAAIARRIFAKGPVFVAQEIRPGGRDWPNDGPMSRITAACESALLRRFRAN